MSDQKTDELFGNASASNADGGENKTTNDQLNTQQKNEDVVSKSQYLELENKVKSKEEEISKWEDYFNGTRSLLDTLSKNPDLLDAIQNGKITGELAKAILDDKVSIQAAETVANAHKEVKEDLGEGKYDKLSPKQIEELIAKKMDEHIKKFDSSIENKLKARDADAEFSRDIETFVSETPDFAEFTDDISKVLDENSEISTIKVAYLVAKGLRADAENSKKSDIAKAQDAKNLATNVSGGSSAAAGSIQDDDILSKLIDTRQTSSLF